MTKLLEAAKAAWEVLNEIVLLGASGDDESAANALEAAIAEEEADGPLTDEFFPESEWIRQREYQFRWRSYPLLTVRCLGGKPRWVWCYGDNPLPFHPQTTKPARDLLRVMNGE